MLHRGASSTLTAPFRLSQSFLTSYSSTLPPFGFNGLGALVYATRYSRVIPTPLGSTAPPRRETWHETVERVVNGTFHMQQRHMEGHGLGWDSGEAQAGAQKMYEKIFRMKFLPPGRGLWAMGTPITEERGLYAALNNCAFVSTGIPPGGDPTEPFTFLMDAAMLGVGVGFDTKGVGIAVPGPPRGGLPQHHLVEDSREGWVHSLRLQLASHFKGTPSQAFDYSAVRPRGTPIKGFGGSAAGGEVLASLHASIDTILAPLAGRALTVTAVCDIMNLIGRAVVSGDVRQTAEIAFGDPHCPEYTALKDYRVNPARAAWGWTSNNSVYATLGQGYHALAGRVAHNGEPGFAWLENMRAYGRMREDERDWKDARAQGGNPCLEQTLESYELCCLVETFPAAHGEDFEDFADTLRTAFHYAKVVTLGATHWTASNRIMARNRRIGTSLSGIAQFIAAAPAPQAQAQAQAAPSSASAPAGKGGIQGGKGQSGGGVGKLVSWCERGYEVVQAADKALSDTLAIPRSIKTTCIKPSGTVSLLAGATPGMHFPESRFYTRRIRLSKDHGVVGALREAGYVVEAANEDPTRKVVVEVPVDVGEGVRTLDEVSMWEQLSLSALLQRHWADNQVSCTVTFDPVTEAPHLPRALDFFQFQLKGVSFLPKSPLLEYPQLPYQSITEEQYRVAVGKLKGSSMESVIKGMAGAGAGAGEGGETQEAPDKFCDTSSCQTVL